MEQYKIRVLRSAFFALIFFQVTAAYTQSCSIVVSGKRICFGEPFNFGVSYSGSINPVNVLWDFGDSTSDNKLSSDHKYAKTGTFNAKVRLIFPNGDTCIAILDSINVVPLPVADFSVTTPDSQCQSGNYFCFLDKSYSLNGQAPIVSRWLNFGDGDADISTPVSVKTLCHTYNNANNYTVTIEVTDSNGCVSRKTLSNSATVYEDLQISFTDSIDQGHCDSTIVRYFNTSGTQPSYIKKFYWIFDDGTIDSVNWESASHTFTGEGPYRPKLVVISAAGCTDTVESLADIMNLKFIFDVTYNSKVQCFSSNFFTFSNTFIPGALFRWRYGDGNSDTGFSVKHAYQNCGEYPVSLTITLPNGCDSVFYDTLIVNGPKTIIENNVYKIINNYQCEIKDTVLFVTPNPYLSQHCKSNNITRIWTFDDPFAPQCTTDTKNGINVGINCNYSKDSINVRHYYTPGKEKCYYPELYLRDNITGCAHSTTSTVVLRKPDAKGLTWAGKECLDFNDMKIKRLIFSLPICGAEEIWVNYDSACGINNWGAGLPNDSFYYRSTCDPDGYVTVGVIVKIGDCYDTAWYHNFLHFPKPSAEFEVDPEYGCAPLKVRAWLRDSIQKGIKYVTWNWGDNTNTTQTIPPGDSVIHSQTHVYTVENAYHVIVSVQSVEGCDTFMIRPVNVGKIKKLTAPPLICLGDTAKFTDYVRYYDGSWPTGYDPTNYWAIDMAPEIISWDFGDGTGFTKTGSKPWYVYQQAGSYIVKMAISDKAGCADTLKKLIKVIKVKADFDTDSLLICPQFVQFYDSSFTGDTTTFGIKDTIATWYWDFGDGKTPAIDIKNPFHVYTSYGTFTVKLVVTNMRGCVDTISKPLTIQGPRPKFRIDGDTMGCVPFTAKFEDLSQDVSLWIWRFGDGATSSSYTGGNISHTYNTPGIYTIFLFGEDTLTNPVTGQITHCAAEYPDTTSPGVKLIQVHVLPRPPVNTTFKDPVCVDEVIDFNDSSDAKYTSYNWYFNDGDSISSIKPNSGKRSFSSAGTYTLEYKPAYVPGLNDLFCPDSVKKSIRVTDVTADFRMDTSGMPLVKFINASSPNAIKYKWNFGQPLSGAKNFSSDKNPEHSYINDTLQRNVCLTAINSEDCEDIVCKPVRNSYFIYLKLYNVFTPDDDRLNDAFDIEIIGEEEYHLNIYNRWGEKVFEGLQDGEGNDGMNWDGTNIFNGEKCGDGVYYFVFNYKFRLEEPKQIHGSVTLISRE